MVEATGSATIRPTACRSATRSVPATGCMACASRSRAVSTGISFCELKQEDMASLTVLDCGHFWIRASRSLLKIILYPECCFPVSFPASIQSSREYCITWNPRAFYSFLSCVRSVAPERLSSRQEVASFFATLKESDSDSPGESLFPGCRHADFFSY